MFSFYKKKIQFILNFLYEFPLLCDRHWLNLICGLPDIGAVLLLWMIHISILTLVRLEEQRTLQLRNWDPSIGKYKQFISCIMRILTLWRTTPILLEQNCWSWIEAYWRDCSRAAHDALVSVFQGAHHGSLVALLGVLLWGFLRSAVGQGRPLL